MKPFINHKFIEDSISSARVQRKAEVVSHSSEQIHNEELKTILGL
jgi:hypothetical protein